MTISKFYYTLHDIEISEPVAVAKTPPTTMVWKNFQTDVPDGIGLIVISEVYVDVAGMKKFETKSIYGIPNEQEIPITDMKAVIAELIYQHISRDVFNIHLKTKSEILPTIPCQRVIYDILLGEEN